MILIGVLHLISQQSTHTILFSGMYVRSILRASLVFCAIALNESLFKANVQMLQTFQA
jgi:hypothetical protein